MADLKDGETTEVQGSGSSRYTLKNIGGAYTCSCPAWRFQAGLPPERRTCKHLRAFRGDEAERQRVGAAAPPAKSPVSGKTPSDAAAPPVLLAQRWDSGSDVTGWWISEKLDGVRAYWTGERFLSRLGNVYHAPDWFVATLPAEPLDGELWVGRKQFQRTVSIARRQDKADAWRELKYLVFDAPRHEGVFEERVAHLEQTFSERPSPHAEPLAHQRCQSVDHLKSELARVEALGGEGLMVRQPQSRYQLGRSSTLLKIKSFFDAEARVVGHQPGSGKHKGRLGALRCELPNGTTFSIGTGLSDADRDSPPAIGSLVTFRYQELTDAGVPRFSSFVGQRHDVSWQHVVASADGQRQSSSPNMAAPTHTAKPKPASAPAATAGSAGAKPETRAPPEPGSVRRLEFSDGGASKFWEVEQVGAEVYLRYGRIGSKGKLQLKTFDGEHAASSYVQSQLLSKLRKGYADVG